MKTIDLTSEKFEELDCTEGYIFFNSFSENEKFEIDVWGATLLNDLKVYDKDVYIASLSKLIFEKVVYVNIDCGIYANNLCTEFRKNKKGDSTSIILKLGNGENLNGYYEYILGGMLGRNIGYGEIIIYCKDRVKFIFDEDTLVDEDYYCKNKQKYIELFKNI